MVRITTSDKVLCNKAFNIHKSSKYDGYQSGFVSLIDKLFDKKSSGGAMKNEIAKNLWKNYINHFLENSKNVKYNNLLKTIIEVLIWYLRNQ